MSFSMWAPLGDQCLQSARVRCVYKQWAHISFITPTNHDRDNTQCLYFY